MSTMYFFLILASVGLAATLAAMGLFRFYEHVSHGNARFLKIMTMTLLLILTIIGAANWAFEEPGAAYVFLALPLGICLLEFFFNKNSFMIRLLRNGMLITVAMVLVGCSILSSITFDFGSSGGCTYNIRNQSGYEIILYEAHFNTKRIFKGKITLQHTAKNWGQGKMLGSPLEKSKKVSLVFYDSRLKKVIWKIVNLPKDQRDGCCDYDIVYGPKGFGQKGPMEFRQKPGICG